MIELELLNAVVKKSRAKPLLSGNPRGLVAARNKVYSKFIFKSSCFLYIFSIDAHD